MKDISVFADNKNVVFYANKNKVTYVKDAEGKVIGYTGGIIQIFIIKV